MSTTIEPQDAARTRPRTSVAQRNGRPATPAAEAAGQSSFWRGKADAELLRGGLDGDAAWKLYWKRRRPKASLAQICDSPGPLAWSTSTGALPSACAAVFNLAGDLAADANHDKYFKGKSRKQLQAALEAWLDYVDVDAMTANPSDSVSLGVSSLAATQVLAAVGGALDPQLGWRLVDRLHHLGAEAIHASPSSEGQPQVFLAEQLLAGELPLTLSCQFGEMAPLYALGKQANQRLTASLSDALNRDGLPRSAIMPILRPLAACWTRCRSMGDAMEAGRWSKQADRRYQKLVRQMLRWSAPDGTALLAAEPSSSLPADFLRQALRLADSKKDVAAAKALFGEKGVGPSLEAAKKGPALDEHCELSGLAVMRSGWTPESAVVAIDYSAAEMKLEVWARDRQLFGGTVQTLSTVNGEQLQPVGNWDELCWFTDKDAAYLELSLDLASGGRLERQILLGRRDGIFLIVDHLKSADGAALRHEWQLPLGPGLLFCGEGETRDALLVDGRPIARLIPLALPEWRIDPRVGELAAADGRVRLSQQAVGTAMACPLFVDLHSERAARQSTWRHLTVVEWLEIQPADVAVAYRVQCGKDQWAYYRAQSSVGNRTFLGQNTSSECIIARFLPKLGELSELVEIES